jgi:hypothetical protein
MYIAWLGPPRRPEILDFDAPSFKKIAVQASFTFGRAIFDSYMGFLDFYNGETI